MNHSVRLISFAECYPTRNRETLLLHSYDPRLEVVFNFWWKNGMGSVIFGSYTGVLLRIVTTIIF